MMNWELGTRSWLLSSQLSQSDLDRGSQFPVQITKVGLIDIYITNRRRGLSCTMTNQNTKYSGLAPPADLLIDMHSKYKHF